MGGVKTALVKRTAQKVLEKVADNFTSEFDHNKKLLKNTVESKKVRNKIAGYISRKKRSNTK
jgi:small subunit ribosomal protein S17e